MDQSETPYLDALRDRARSNPGRFHIPGHKGGRGANAKLIEAIGSDALLLDLPSGVEGIDIGPDPHDTPFQHAQQLAAEAWGAKRSWFLVNGASGGNHAICMALAHSGLSAVIQRNVHSSVIDGLVLSGIAPHFVAPEIDNDMGIAHCLAPDTLDEALTATPDAVAAFAVSPTYFGAVADIAGLAEVAHRHDVPLVVDESWGAHLAFSPELPENALARGADVVLNSVHKLGGSLTQSAVVHLGSDRLDEAVLDRSVTLVESTSPSGLLTASLDAARSQAATRGEELLAETIASLRELRTQVREIKGLDVLDQEIAEHPSVFAWDPLRLTIDVRRTGATGHELARLMQERHNIWFELYAENVVVAVFGIGEPVAETGARLLDGLRDAAAELNVEGEIRRVKFAPPPPWGPTEMTPRDAFLGDAESVGFDAAEGRIAAESLAAYPPGVPNVLPGERLTRETLDYIADSLAHGGQVRGASDRTLRTIRVVIE
jgi:arginine decarboxylase